MDPNISDLDSVWFLLEVRILAVKGIRNILVQLLIPYICEFSPFKEKIHQITIFCGYDQFIRLLDLDIEL